MQALNNLVVCQSVWHCGIGNDRMPGIVALGMPRGPALLYNEDFECQGVWHWVCQGSWHRLRRYARGSGIASISMPWGLALEMPRGLALLLFECRVSDIGNAKACGIGSMFMPRGAA